MKLNRIHYFIFLKANSRTTWLHQGKEKYNITQNISKEEKKRENFSTHFIKRA